MPRGASVFLCHKLATTRKKPRTKGREGAGIFQPIRGIYEGKQGAGSMVKNQPPKMVKSTPQIGEFNPPKWLNQPPKLVSPKIQPVQNQ